MERNKTYIVYKIINTLNNKEYIGVHGTYDINDNYMGSGKYLKLAMALENEGKGSVFTKTIISQHSSKEDAYADEARLVTQEYVEREDTYNIQLGGEGGWSTESREASKTEEALEKRSKSCKKAVEEGRLRTLTPKQRRMGIDAKGMLNKKHTEETRKQISENNGNKLSEEVIAQRIKDFYEIGGLDKRGNRTKLAKRWEVTGISVTRFCKKQNLI